MLMVLRRGELQRLLSSHHLHARYLLACLYTYLATHRCSLKNSTQSVVQGLG